MSNIIWESKISGDYIATADRLDGNTAKLVVKNAVTGTVILDQTVSLEFGSSGVSTRDITSWYTMATSAINSQ